MNIAEQGIAELSEYVDSLITVPNEKLLGIWVKTRRYYRHFLPLMTYCLARFRGLLISSSDLE